ncbi:zinc ribbon domain-containing protein [Anaerotignum sp.]|uniref:zinc ribbon domain-containing protein n=1 Tax=Anaerotignum sp. TaxID=2039241 RepID=UPI0028AB7C83|nr:zinc ribbon domain-containing protein [Anaerotignum sp.]
MIFIGGISQGHKDLGFLQTLICKKCGRFSSVSVYMVYTYFSFFFIPLFKWGKKYYAVSNCCQTTFSIPDELGKAIERGESVSLREEDLEIVGMATNNYSNCPDCGFLLTPEYTYCPKCGRKI